MKWYGNVTQSYFLTCHIPLSSGINILSRVYTSGKVCIHLRFCLVSVAVDFKESSDFPLNHTRSLENKTTLSPRGVYRLTLFSRSEDKAGSQERNSNMNVRVGTTFGRNRLPERECERDRKSTASIACMHPRQTPVYFPAVESLPSIPDRVQIHVRVRIPINQS